MANIPAIQEFALEFGRALGRQVLFFGEFGNWV
jgi:hypothetical protein